MLDQDTRTTILRLTAEGVGARGISKMLSISRNAVKRVIKSQQAEVPPLARDTIAAEHIETIRELHRACEGNIVRVGEELAAAGVVVGYSTLTRFCREHGIGTKPKQAAGRYEFAPGEEMQHDTSPHRAKVGGHLRLLQCASLVLCHSSMVFAQAYPTFNRFWCKSFLTDGIVYFGGAADRCVVDNSNLVIASGTGPDAIIAPEMVAFGDRFDFTFLAHRKGDKNRSARVERPFDYIERNFYPGRTFADLNDLNRQLLDWCDKVNGAPKSKTRYVPRELFAVERAHLKPLPRHVPEVYQLHQRIVDIEAYVNVHGNRYSVDEQWIGRHVEVRESKTRIRVFDGHREIATHARVDDGAKQRITLAEHRGQRRSGFIGGSIALPEEGPLRLAAPELAAMLDAIKQRYGGHAARRIRRLHRFWMDYPIEPLRAALAAALEHGLLDLDRVEVMVLRGIAKDFFRIPNTTHSTNPIDPEDEFDV